MTMTGTSQAAPHVTGALALVLSHRQKLVGSPQHNAVQLRTAINRTAQPGGLHDPAFGYGRLDALALFNDLL
jgi:subtilisin family serine protease